MAENFETHEDDHHENIPTATIALVAGILSLLFGLVATLTNGILLVTLYKDPFNHFRSRATTFFVTSLSVSDFLGGFVVQPLYSVYMLGIASGTVRQGLFNVCSVFSHANTKISVLTVVALSVDRFLAVKLSWKYKTIVTVRRVLILNSLIWIFCGTFEVVHITSHASERIFHAIDLHLQTTIPIALLCAVYLATFLEFRRYSRNVVFVRKIVDGRSRTYIRNIRLEKKIALTIVFIIIILFISLVPFLVVMKLEEPCHEDHSDECEQPSPAFWIAKSLAIPMLCISCIANPFLYAWRIPQYRQAAREMGRSFCNKWRHRMLRSKTPISNIKTAVASGSSIEQNPVPEVDQSEQNCQNQILHSRASAASEIA